MWLFSFASSKSNTGESTQDNTTAVENEPAAGDDASPPTPTPPPKKKLSATVLSALAFPKGKGRDRSLSSVTNSSAHSSASNVSEKSGGSPKRNLSSTVLSTLSLGSRKNKDPKPSSPRLTSTNSSNDSDNRLSSSSKAGETRGGRASSAPPRSPSSTGKNNSNEQKEEQSFRDLDPRILKALLDTSEDDVRQPDHVDAGARSKLKRENKGSPPDADRGDIDITNAPALKITASTKRSTFSEKSSFLYDLGPVALAEGFKPDLKLTSLSNVKHLCNGSHSVISTATVGENREKVVVKIMRVSEASAGSSTATVLREFARECAILSRLSHDNVCRLIAAGEGHEGDGEESPVPFLVLEHLAGGSLRAMLTNKRKSFGKPFAASVFFSYSRQLCEALNFLHSEFLTEGAVVHRDLKPDNIGFDGSYRLKLMDFGLAVCIKREAGKLTERFEMTGKTGSLRYMSNEVALNQPYNEKADIYSLGIVLYEMWTGVAPFGHLKRDAFIRQVSEGGERPNLQLDDYGRSVRADKSLEDLLQGCWHAEADRRPSAADCVAALSALQQKSQAQWTFFGF